MVTGGRLSLGHVSRHTAPVTSKVISFSVETLLLVRMKAGTVGLGLWEDMHKHTLVCVKEKPLEKYVR